MRDMLDAIREAAAEAGLAARVDEHGHHLFEAEGRRFRLLARVKVGEYLGLSFRVTGEGCRTLEWEEDNDLYPVTGPKHGPAALEQAEDFAAFIRAFAARHVLVGCRHGGMVFTVPLRKERLYASRKRFHLVAGAAFARRRDG